MVERLENAQALANTLDPVVGTRIGYYTILKRAGRNRYYQQRYTARCECCGQVFTKTLFKLREADGKITCKHTKRSTKPAAVPHPCAFCGKITTNLKYCSNSCKAAATNMKTKTKPPKRCLLCGKPTPNRKSNLCGPECRRLHRLQRMYGFDVEPFVNGGD